MGVHPVHAVGGHKSPEEAPGRTGTCGSRLVFESAVEGSEMLSASCRVSRVPSYKAGSVQSK